MTQHTPSQVSGDKTRAIKTDSCLASLSCLLMSFLDFLILIRMSLSGMVPDYNKINEDGRKSRSHENGNRVQNGKMVTDV